MTKRFTAVIIVANFIAGLLLYLSSQAMLFHLTAIHPYLTLTEVNVDKIFVGAVQPYTSSTPLVITTFPNLPFFILLLPLIINAYFILKISRNLNKTKRFSTVIIVANFIIDLLMYLSSQTMLFSLVGTMNNYVRVLGVNFFSFSVGAVQVGSSPIPLVVFGEANLTSYIVMLSLIVNTGFMINLLSEKFKQALRARLRKN